MLFVNLIFREEKEKWVRAKYEGKEFLGELPPCDFSLGEVSARHGRTQALRYSNKNSIEVFVRKTWSHSSISVNSKTLVRHSAQ